MGSTSPPRRRPHDKPSRSAAWFCACSEITPCFGVPKSLDFPRFRSPHLPAQNTVVSMNTVTAVYIRVSTQDQKTDSQLRELKHYCQQRGWKKVEFFVDKISGEKSTRPELDRMLKEVRAGRVERVVTY